MAEKEDSVYMRNPDGTIEIPGLGPVIEADRAEPEPDRTEHDNLSEDRRDSDSGQRALELLRKWPEARGIVWSNDRYSEQDWERERKALLEAIDEAR